MRDGSDRTDVDGKHNTKKDAWVAFNGKVYSMTRYMRYHPGGEDQLMRCAGRDGTKLFSGSDLQMITILC